MALPKIGSEFQPHTQSILDDGSWLSTPGPYRDYIAAWCQLNPNLKWSDWKNRWTPMKTGHARVTMLEIEQGNKAYRSDFSTARDLSEHLKLSSAQTATQTLSPKRIYIMEGLAPDFIAALGGHFLIDPTFFMTQERTTLWGLFQEGSKQTPSLPSLADSKKAFALRYYELRDFGEITTFNLWCARTSRNISAVRTSRRDLYSLKFQQVGIVNRKCSFWSCGDDEAWNAIILCDPPVEQIFVQEKDQKIQHSVGPRFTHRVPNAPLPLVRTVPNIPYAGGYLDFIKHPENATNVPAGPPRTSILEDICFYFIEHGHNLTKETGPATAAIFMKKIVASLYMQLVEAVRADIWSIEYQLSREDSLSNFEVSWIEERWSDIRSWSRRCSQYVNDVEAIIISLGIPFSAFPVEQSASKDWTSCEKDFQYIYYSLKTLQVKVEAVSNSITGLAGIAGNRQALQETKRSLREAKAIKTLTLLGMVFIPLAFCTGIFSMNDRYLPGTASFWVYFAVSIPLVIGVFCVAFLVSCGYDTEGEWSLKTFIQTFSNAGTSS